MFRTGSHEVRPMNWGPAGPFKYPEPIFVEVRYPESTQVQFAEFEGSGSSQLVYSPIGWQPGAQNGFSQLLRTILFGFPWSATFGKQGEALFSGEGPLKNTHSFGQRLPLQSPNF